ncbi:14765_t:CDS:2 [Acaulospora colombiana]|uniref:14765_t:CDS:1 n=1 Tax=Acaulospora colombiana TaxID=27376 RepID=A0ACA9NTB2_9GLOM|nr:14765_t:CDS:2 [Acaulospora colombiana]
MGSGMAQLQVQSTPNLRLFSNDEKLLLQHEYTNSVFIFNVDNGSICGGPYEQPGLQSAFVRPENEQELILIGERLVVAWNPLCGGGVLELDKLSNEIEADLPNGCNPMYLSWRHQTLMWITDSVIHLHRIHLAPISLPEPAGLLEQIKNLFFQSSQTSQQPSPVVKYLLSPNGNHLATLIEGTIQIWDCNSGTLFMSQDVESIWDVKMIFADHSLSLIVQRPQELVLLNLEHHSITQFKVMDLAFVAFFSFTIALHLLSYG